MTDLSSQIVNTEATFLPTVNVLDKPPADMVTDISIVAGMLKNIIDKQKMYVNINSKKYVTVEGWNTLGAMVGLCPIEKEVRQIKGGWEARVDLINRNNSMVMGSGSAICTRDEKMWSKRDEYAIRSMSITRATGKAYRLGLSWVMSMAGFEPTPAEEMPSHLIKNVVPKAAIAQPATKTTAPKPKQATNTTEVFNMDNQKHLDDLGDYLDKNGIQKSKYLPISEAMNGRPKTVKAIDNVIAEICK